MVFVSKGPRMRCLELGEECEQTSSEIGQEWDLDPLPLPNLQGHPFPVEMVTCGQKKLPRRGEGYLSGFQLVPWPWCLEGSLCFSKGDDGSGPEETPPHLVKMKADPPSLRRAVASSRAET